MIMAHPTHTSMNFVLYEYNLEFSNVLFRFEYVELLLMSLSQLGYNLEQ